MIVAVMEVFSSNVRGARERGDLYQVSQEAKVVGMALILKPFQQYISPETSKLVIDGDPEEVDNRPGVVGCL